MGVAGVLLLTALGVVVTLAAPLELAFGTLVAFWLLVPGDLIVPHAPHLLFVNRVVLFSFGFRLLIRYGRAGEPRRASYALTSVHAALGVFLLVGYVNGVLLAPRSTSLAGDLHGWISQLDLAVLFVVVLAVARTLGVWKVVRIVVGVLLVAVVIGIAERFSGHGWSHFFFDNLPASYIAPGASPLSTRGGAYRSQAAAQFALEYGWVLALFLPMTIFAALRWYRTQPESSRLVLLFRRAVDVRRIALLAPVAMFCAVVFSISRSAEVAAVVAAVLLFFVALDKRLVPWAAAVCAVALVAFVADSSFFTSAFSSASSVDPTTVRLDRLPTLFALVVHRPFTGLGFSGISTVFGGLDNAYALMYSQTGVLGIVTWAALVVTAFVATIPALRTPRGSDTRTLGAACLVGIIGVAIAAATYDLISTPQSSWALMVLGAVGVCTAETVKIRHQARLRRRWALRMAVPVAGIGVGMAALALAPTTSSEALSILTVAPWVPATGGVVDLYQGTALTNTLCGAVTNPDTLAPNTSVTCQQAVNLFPTDYPALALVDVQGPSPAAVRAELVRSFTPIYKYLPMAGGATQTIQTGKPAWATTAPQWLGSAGLLAVLLSPAIPVRRRRRGASPPSELSGAV